MVQCLTLYRRHCVRSTCCSLPDSKSMARQRRQDMSEDERFEMNVSLVLVALITVGCVAPWVFHLIFMLILFVLLNKYTWMLVAGVGAFYYLCSGRAPSGDARVEAKADEAVHAREAKAEEPTKEAAGATKDTDSKKDD